MSMGTVAIVCKLHTLQKLTPDPATLVALNLSLQAKTTLNRVLVPEYAMGLVEEK
jgi:hypothetical protein